MVAIWLVPSAEDREKLSTLLQPQHDTSHLSQSSYPKIDPHVTLASVPGVGVPELRAAVQATLESDLALHYGEKEKEKKKIEIKFASVEVGTHYFRSVYVAVERSATLAALHKGVHARLGVEERTPSFPHVSLCYVADEDEEKFGERGRFERGLRVGGYVRDNETDRADEEGEGGGGVSLRCGEEWVSGWAVEEVWFVDCVGPVEEWRILERMRV